MPIHHPNLFPRERVPPKLPLNEVAKDKAEENNQSQTKAV
jgi:hypothetical protein